MKKIFSTLLMLAFLVQSAGVTFAQDELVLSGTTMVNVENTDTCFAKATDAEKFGGKYSLHLKAGASDWIEVTQNLTATAKAGTEYVLTVHAKKVSGNAWFRVNWDDLGWLASTQADFATDVGNGWKKYVKNITLAADQTKILLHNDGAAEYYLDDISLVKVGDTENLIPDGGFEEVIGGNDTPELPEEEIPTGDLILSDTTMVSVENTDTCFAKATAVEKFGGKYSLHLKAGASDWIEVTQNLTATAKAGTEYVLTVHAKKVSGNAWFRVNWDDLGWLASTQADFATDVGNGWKKYVKNITLAADQTKILLHNDGAAEYYLDDISLVKVGDTENLIPDGGFEEVTIASDEEPADPPEHEKYETIILTCTDFQSLSGSEVGAQTVTSIINTIEADGIISADAFFCCGDYANTYNETEANLEILKETVIDFVPDEDKHIYVQGNHDAEIGTEGLAKSGDNDPESGEYGVFVINEDDYMWYNSDKERIKATAGNLASYLNEKLEDGYDKPIFVLSHLPLYKSWRTTIDGDAKHANQLFHVLNQAGEQGLNIIFMYGHDHSNGYDSYLGGSAVYLAKGDSINIAQGDVTVFQEETLNFTYMNAGYVGYYASATGRDSDLNMVVIGIDEDTDSVDVYRYDKDGLHNLKSAGVLKTEEVTAGDYEADTTVYTSPQTITLTEVNYEYDIETLPDVDVDINEDDDSLILSNTTKIEGTQSETRYARATDNDKHSGNYSLRLYSATAGFEFGQQFTVENLPAGAYTVTWYAKGSDGNMAFWSNWGENVRNVSITPEVQSNGWKKYTAELNIDGSGDTRFLFYADTPLDCYMDDISLVDENGINYIIDGGFEEVTIAGGEENTGDRYPKTFVLSETTTVSEISDDGCYAEVSDSEYQGDEGFGLHFGSSGNVNFTVTQMTTESLETGEEYILTVYGKRVSGRVWFRAGWGEDAWMVVAEDGEDVGDGWKKYQKTLTIDEKGASDLFFYSDQATEFYLDDISLVKVGEEANLMPDGGFSEVTVIEPEIPDYEVFEPVLMLNKQVVDSVSATGSYKVSVNAKNNAVTDGLGCEVLVAVFDASGEMLNLYSSAKTVEMTEPNAKDTSIPVSFEIISEGCSADVYVINNRQEFDVYYNPVKY